MAQIDITNTININLSGQPRGLSNFVVANTVIFSNEQAGFSEQFRSYVSPDDVAKDFGSNSVTSYMATKLFAPTPNLRSGRGTLYVVPYIATNATSGSVTTEDLTANVDDFKTISNGELKLTIDGTEVTLKQMNFTGIKKLSDIANVILAKNPDCFIEVVSDSAAQKLKFTSKRFGTDSEVAIETISGGTGTDISGANYLNGSTVTTTAGVNAVDTETLVEAINRVKEKISFGIILDTCYRENAAVKANATNIETMDKIYAEVTASLDNMGVLGSELLLGGFTHTKLTAYSLGQKEAKGALAAYISYAVSTNWSGTDTALTMNLKELATVDPDSNLTQTYYNLAKANGVDIYANTQGLACVYSFKGAGGYIDDMTGSLSLAKDLEVAGFNYLRQTNTKVPQTELGMTNLKNAFAKVWEKYVTNGFLGTGLKWNGTKFGDPEDFDENIYNNGYYQYSIPIAEQSQADREDRIAPLIQAAGKSAGAIHVVEVSGTLEK